MQILYRKARQEDLDEIMQMIQCAVNRMEENGIFQWDEIYPTRADFAEDLRKGYMTVGEIQEKIAVVYTISRECDEAYQNGQWENQEADFCVIHRLCVNPSFQNQRVAANTLQHIENIQRKAGTDSIRLDVFSENPAALRLYESAGYCRTGYADWRKGRFYLMEKVL